MRMSTLSLAVIAIVCLATSCTPQEADNEQCYDTTIPETATATSTTPVATQALTLAHDTAIATTTATMPLTTPMPTTIPLTTMPLTTSAEDLRTEQAQAWLDQCKWTVKQGLSKPTLIEVYSKPLILTDAERKAVIGVITAETGGYCYDNLGVMTDRLLVAQCIREDLERNNLTIFKAANGIRYAKPHYDGTSEQARLAYDLVFGDGKGVVEHGIKYFYNPKLVSSKFHESQVFVAETKQHRYFK